MRWRIATRGRRGKKKKRGTCARSVVGCINFSGDGKVRLLGNMGFG